METCGWYGSCTSEGTGCESDLSLGFLKAVLKTVRGRWYIQTMSINTPAVKLESDTVSDDALQLGADGLPGETGFEMSEEFARDLEIGYQECLRGEYMTQEEVTAMCAEINARAKRK